MYIYIYTYIYIERERDRERERESVMYICCSAQVICVGSTAYRKLSPEL